VALGQTSEKQLALLNLEMEVVTIGTIHQDITGTPTTVRSLVREATVLADIPVVDETSTTTTVAEGLAAEGDSTATEKILTRTTRYLWADLIGPQRPRDYKSTSPHTDL